MGEIGTEIEEEESKTSKKKAKDVMSKIVVRCLPPSFNEEEVINILAPLPECDYRYYAQPDWSLGQFASTRLYLNLVNPDDVITFKEKWDGYTFIDAGGHEYVALVEYTPYQKTPRECRKKEDKKCGTITEDPEYLEFLELYENTETEPVNAAAIHKQILEEIEERDKEATKVSTPLLDYLNERKVKRDEERKRERERWEEARKRRQEEKVKREAERRKKREQERKDREEKRKEEAAAAAIAAAKRKSTNKSDETKRSEVEKTSASELDPEPLMNICFTGDGAQDDDDSCIVTKTDIDLVQLNKTGRDANIPTDENVVTSEKDGPKADDIRNKEPVSNNYMKRERDRRRDRERYSNYRNNAPWMGGPPFYGFIPPWVRYY